MTSVHQIPVKDLKVKAGFNARVDTNTVDALADSIRLVGVLVPLIVTPDGEVIAGHRRLAAAKLAGVDVVPVVLRPQTAGEGAAGGMAADAAIENIAREQLTPNEEATAIGRMLEAGYSEDGAAKVLAMPLARVTRRVALLRLPDEMRSRYGPGGDGRLSAVPLLAALNEKAPVMVQALAHYPMDRSIDSWFLAHVANDLLGVGDRYDATRRPKGLPKPPAEFTWLSAHSRAPREILGKLPAETKRLWDQLDAGRNVYGNATVKLERADIDAATAAGVTVTLPGEDEDGRNELMVVINRPWLIDRLTRDMLPRAIAQKAKTETPAKTPGKTLTAREQAEADAHAARRTEQRAIADAARGVNLDLGTALMTKLATVPVTMDVARIFVEGVLGPRPPKTAGYTDRVRERPMGRAAAGGLRYVIGDWQTETTKQLASGKAGKTKITYLDDEEAERRAWAWLDGAKTPQELFGRALVILAAYTYAFEEVVPSSQRMASRSYRDLLRSKPANDLIAKLAKSVLPASVGKLARRAAKA